MCVFKVMFSNMVDDPCKGLKSFYYVPKLLLPKKTGLFPQGLDELLEYLHLAPCPPGSLPPSNLWLLGTLVFSFSILSLKDYFLLKEEDPLQCPQSHPMSGMSCRPSSQLTNKPRCCLPRAPAIHRPRASQSRVPIPLS